MEAFAGEGGNRACILVCSTCRVHRDRGWTPPYFHGEEVWRCKGAAPKCQEQESRTAVIDVLELTWTLDPPGPPGPGLDPRPPSRGGA